MWDKPFPLWLSSSYVWFFITKLGRRIIGSKSVGAIKIHNSWKDKGISGDLLKSFWRRLWVLDTLEKIKVWLCLLSHKAVHIGKWLSSRVVRLAVSYVRMLWNQSLNVSRIVHRRLAFAVEASKSRQLAVWMGTLYGVPYRVLP